MREYQFVGSLVVAGLLSASLMGCGETPPPRPDAKPAKTKPLPSSTGTGELEGSSTRQPAEQPDESSTVPAPDPPDPEASGQPDR